MSDVDKTAKIRPLGEFQGHSPSSRLDFTVLGVERLIKSANVDAAVTGCDTNVNGTANVMTKCDGLVAASDGVDVFVDVENHLTQCRPSVIQAPVAYLTGGHGAMAPFGSTMKIFYRRLYIKRCVFAVFQQELQNSTMFDGFFHTDTICD